MLILKRSFNLSKVFSFILLVILICFTLQGCAEKFTSPHDKYFEVFSTLEHNRKSSKIFSNKDKLFMFSDLGIDVLNLNDKITKTIYNTQFFSRKAIETTANIYTFRITSKNAVSIFDLNSESVTNYSFDTSIDNNAFELFKINQNVFVLMGGKFKEGYHIEILDMNNPKQEVTILPLPKDWIAIRKVFEEDTYIYILVSVSTGVERENNLILYKLNKENLELKEVIMLGKSKSYY